MSLCFVFLIRLTDIEQSGPICHQKNHVLFFGYYQENCYHYHHHLYQRVSSTFSPNG